MLDAIQTLPSHTQALLVFICGLTVLFNVRFSEKTVTYGPTILTTTGIFATFVGIAIGLFHFDASNIQASVPSLLEGLKTAFWASVAGVGGALIIKFRHYFFGVAYATGPNDPASNDDVTGADLVRQLSNIQQALVGEDDSTLISQLKLTRSDTNDRLDALKRAQSEALKALSEMGSKALVEALRDVIKDFNQKISEQFGENFRHLNDAVGKLLIWQEENKERMSTLTDQISSVSKAMNDASDAYQKLLENADGFSQVSRDLSVLLSGLQTQKDQLNTALNSLAQLLLSASGSLPQIESKVLELVQQLANAVTSNQREIDRVLSANAQSQTSLVESLRTSMAKLGQDTVKQLADFSQELTAAIQFGQRLANDALTLAQQTNQKAMSTAQEIATKAIQNAQTETSKALSDLQQNVSIALRENSDVLKNAVSSNTDLIRTTVQQSNETLSKTNQDFNKHVAEMSAKTKEQVTALDAALSEELTKSLESLGRQLSALSEKFVQDYTPLTDQLRKVVQLGRSA